MTHSSDLPPCPKCNQSTSFVPAALIVIANLDHIEYFYKSPHFSYLITEGEDGVYLHMAAHFLKCDERIPSKLSGLPEPYDPSLWQLNLASATKYEKGEIGTLICNSCAYFEKHIVGEHLRLS